MSIFKEIYAYREMIRGLVRRDLRGRYKASVLGFMWTFINPFLQLLVYTLVFSIIMRSGIEKYYLHLFVALIPWMFFSTSLSYGCNCIIEQKAMVTKIYFPREVLPISQVVSSFVNMCYCFVVVFAVVFISGVRISLSALLTLPLIMVIEFALALGICLLLSASTVYFRDLAHITGIVTMAWQFLTPVMYSVDMVPAKLLPIFYLNPMTPVIVAYRDILYYGRAPQLSTLGLSFLFGIVFLVVGFVVFNRLKRGFAEML